LLSGIFFSSSGSSLAASNHLAIWSRDSQLSCLSDLDLLVLSSVEDLENVLAELLAWTSLNSPGLKQKLDVSELAEVEVALLV